MQKESREKATRLLDGSVFSHVDEDGEIVLISKEGKEILIGSYHSVWNYGDDSADSVTVAYGSDVFYLTEFEGE